MVVVVVVLGNSGVFPLYLEGIFYYSIDRVVLFMSSYWVWLAVDSAAVAYVVLAKHRTMNMVYQSEMGARIPGCVVDVFYWTGIG